jgi:hypothetical protein
MRLVVLIGEDIAQSIGAIYTLRDEIREIVLLSNNNEEEKRQAFRFKRNLQYFSKKFGLNWSVTTETFYETAIESIHNLYKKVTKDGMKVIFFSSDANAAPTIVLGSFFLQNRATLLSYDAYDNTIFKIEKGRVTTKSADKMDIETYCSMLGYEIVEYIDEKEFIKDREGVCKLFEKEKRFQEVRRALLNGSKDFPYNHYEDIMKLLNQIDILEDNRLKYEHNKRRLQGQLFEEYVYWQCKEAGFEDVKLGCKIDFLAHSKEQSHVINEFDVLFIENNRIGTVECKYVHRLDGLLFVYKYDAVVDYFGRTARALIVNIYQREKRKGQEENFYNSVLKRARLGNVRVYTDKVFDPAQFKKHLSWMKS